jgi:hypothetical protein
MPPVDFRHLLDDHIDRHPIAIRPGVVAENGSWGCDQSVLGLLAKSAFESADY